MAKYRLGRIAFILFIASAGNAAAQSTAPQARGVKVANDPPATDRPGGDFTHFPLTNADPALCTRACISDQRCRAYTYVSPGVQGSQPVCWLKNLVPAPVGNSCCQSGIIDRGGQAMVDASRKRPVVDDMQLRIDARVVDLKRARDEQARISADARRKRQEVDELRRRIAAREADLKRAQEQRRRTIEELRRWDEAHPDVTASPMISDNVSPIERDLKELRAALAAAEREAAQAEAAARARQAAK